MPKVSVVMPAYNAEKYIGEAIESILNQTFTDFEFIIVDDCSKDKTADIVNSYSDKRIRFYQNGKNMGVAATLNKAIQYANGDYIARMDSDDISKNTRLEKQFQFLEKNRNINVLATNVQVFGSNTNSWPSSENNDMLKIDLLFNSCICHPTVMFRYKSELEKDLHYDEYFDHLEDYELWERLIQKNEFACLQEELFMYRIHSNQVTKKRDELLFEKYCVLKERIISRLNMDTKCEEFFAFVNFCFDKNTLTENDYKLLRPYLETIGNQNKIYNIYSQVLLEKYLAGIIINTFTKKSERLHYFFRNYKLFGNSLIDKAKALLKALRY